MVWKVFFLKVFFSSTTQNLRVQFRGRVEGKERGMDLELSVREVDAKR